MLNTKLKGLLEARDELLLFAVATLIPMISLISLSA
jgi:hypothetical protein